MIDTADVVTVDQLEEDIQHLTKGLRAIATPDQKLWAGEIPFAVQKFAQGVLDTRWHDHADQ